MDDLNQTGKYLKGTRGKVDRALDRHRKHIPNVERMRDIFDDTDSFKMDFKTKEEEHVQMSLYFSPGIDVTNQTGNCSDCFCYICETFTATDTTYTLQYNPIDSSVRVRVDGVLTTDYSLNDKDLTLLAGTLPTLENSEVFSYVNRVGFTLSNSPTPGNLVIMQIYWAGSDNPLTETGWDLQSYETFNNHLANRRSAVWSRTWVSGDSDTISIDDGFLTKCTVTVTEWSGATIFDATSYQNNEQLGGAGANGGVISVSGTVAGDAGFPMAVLAYGATIDGDTPDPSDNTWAGTPTLTELAQNDIGEGFAGAAYVLDQSGDATYTYEVTQVGGFGGHQTGQQLHLISLVGTFGGEVRVCYTYKRIDCTSSAESVCTDNIDTFTNRTEVDTWGRTEETLDHLWTTYVPNIPGSAGVIDGTGFLDVTSVPTQVYTGYASLNTGDSRLIATVLDNPEGTMPDLFQPGTSWAIDFRADTLSTTSYLVIYWEGTGDYQSVQLQMSPINPPNPNNVFGMNSDIINDSSYLGIQPIDATLDAFAFVPNTWYTMRVKDIDNVLYAKIWPSVDAQPDDWQIHVDIEPLPWTPKEFLIAAQSGNGETTHWEFDNFTKCPRGADGATDSESNPDPGPDDTGNDNSGGGSQGGSGSGGGTLPPPTTTFSGDGTGATNVYTELQAFFDALPADAVPTFSTADGIYNIGSNTLTITAQNNLAVAGIGSTITGTSLVNTPIVVIQGTGTTVKLDNLKVKGSAPGGYNATYASNNGIEIRGAIGLDLNACNIYNVGGSGVYISADGAILSDTIRVHNSVIDGTGKHGVEIADGATNITIDYNTLRNIGYHTFSVEPDTLGITNTRFKYNNMGTSPYASSRYFFSCVGAGAADTIEVSYNKMISEGYILMQILSPGARSNFIISNNEGFGVFATGGDVITAQGVSTLTVTNNTQLISSGTLLNSSGSTGVTNSGNVTTSPIIIVPTGFPGWPAHAAYNISGGTNVLIEQVYINGGGLTSPSGIGITIANVNGTITIRDVDLQNLIGGIYITNCTGTLVIERLRSVNIGNSTIGSGHSNHVQLATSRFEGTVSDCKFLAGRTEDMFSIWHSGGVSAGHELVFENNQWQGLVTTTTLAQAWDSGSGTGIILSDGAGHAYSGNIIVRNNTFLTPGQVGIQFIDGPNLQVYNNIIYGQKRPGNNNPATSWEGNPIGTFHDNRYYWTNDNNNLISPWFSAYGTITQSNNTQDATLNPASYVITL